MRWARGARSFAQEYVANAGSAAAQAHNKEVAKSTCRLRGTPRFAQVAWKIPHLVNDFSCALNVPIAK